MVLDWTKIEEADEDIKRQLSVMLWIPSKGQFGVKQGFWSGQYGCWCWYGCPTKREALGHQPTHFALMPEPPEEA